MGECTLGSVREVDGTLGSVREVFDTLGIGLQLEMLVELLLLFISVVEIGVIESLCCMVLSVFEAGE